MVGYLRRIISIQVTHINREKVDSISTFIERYLCYTKYIQNYPEPSYLAMGGRLYPICFDISWFQDNGVDMNVLQQIRIELREHEISFISRIEDMQEQLSECQCVEGLCE